MTNWTLDTDYGTEYLIFYERINVYKFLLTESLVSGRSATGN